MSSQLQATKELNGNQWRILAFVLPNGTLPLNIFVYENTGTTTLGTFFGTASVEDLTRMQTWTGLAIPRFGNKYVLYNQAKINVDPTSTPDSVIAVLVNSVKLLSIALVSTSLTQVINIP
jgi:hypothetical protein